MHLGFPYEVTKYRDFIKKAVMEGKAPIRPHPSFSAPLNDLISLLLTPAKEARPFFWQIL